MPIELADQFIDRLVNAGIVPRSTIHVIIDAQVGEITKLHFTTSEIDSDILDALAPRVEEAKVDRRNS